MHLSSVRTCQYQGWWNRRALRDSGNSSRHAEESTIQLPLPSFPPPLDFDPSRFTLPPTYDEVVDLEKAIHPVWPRSRVFSDSSTPSLASDLEKDFRDWTKTEEDPFHAPIRRHTRVLCCLRYTIFTVYRRLFTFVFVINIIVGFILLHHYRSPNFDSTYLSSILSTLASANFLLAILVRQDYLINLLFRSAWIVPWTFPLCIRHLAARVYCYGGIHSGAAVAGTMWWLLFTFHSTSPSSLVITILTSVLLVSILILSYPALRHRHHNAFELSHRLLGWSCIALFWIQLLLSPLPLLSPTFPLLTCTTLLIIYPWLRLRRWTFTPSPLSAHAVLLSFPYSIHRFSCLSVSTSPWREWHPFATFPSASHAQSHMLVSNAGDWTRRLILRTHLAQTKELTLWTRPHPKAGVLSLSLLFPRILILTTGSGIGPALSSLLERPAGQHARLVWATRAPLDTYGPGIMAAVAKADPEAVVIDTDAAGRPDLLEVCLCEARREAVDAVFVLSNRSVTERVVRGVRERGGRAYGPIWDS
jgi:hypothetical protein